jgi:hypothetical protein
MANLEKKIDAERRMRDLLESAGLPQPNAVEYGNQCVRLFWHDPKTVVVIDLDEPAENGMAVRVTDLEREE